jgi:ADP-ribosylglycohydrolase
MNAAIVGGLLGAFYGVKAIPEFMRTAITEFKP